MHHMMVCMRMPWQTEPVLQHVGYVHIAIAGHLDGLTPASRPDPKQSDNFWNMGDGWYDMHLDQVPGDAPKHTDLGRYSVHLSGASFHESKS